MAINVDTNSATARTLNERTIMVGPSPFDREIAAEVEARGGRALRWPDPYVEALENQSSLDEAIENLFGYDWIVFLNAHAVKYFFRRYHALDRKVSDLDSLRVCAVGAATAERLEAATVHVDIHEANARSMIEAVLKYVDSDQGLNRLNFLIPSAEGTRIHLGSWLEDQGARADVVPTYRTAPRECIAQLAALLAGGAIDGVVFSDSATVNSFAELFDVGDLSQILAGTRVMCGDAASADVCAAFQRAPDVIADEHTVRGVIAGIEQTVVNQTF